MQTSLRITALGSGGAGESEGEQGLGEAVGVVAKEVAFEREVAGDGFYAEGADAVEVGGDGGLAAEGVLFQQRGRDGGGVDEGVVEDAGVFSGGMRSCAVRTIWPAVLEDLFDVLGCGEAERLVGLGHEVADVDAGGVGCGEGFGDAADEQVGDQRGVERAWAEGDEVGVGDGFEGGGKGFDIGGREHEFDDAVGAGGDAGLAVDERARVHARGEGDVAVGGGIDAASGGEDLGGHLHGLGEVSGDAGERGEEEVAEAVALQAALMEAVLEEAGEQELVLGERDHTVAHVAGREHVEFFAETAGGATVVCDGDDGGEVADEAGKVGGERIRLGIGVAEGDGFGGVAGCGGRGDVSLEAAQQGGEAGAAADGDYSEILC